MTKTSEQYPTIPGHPNLRRGNSRARSPNKFTRIVKDAVLQAAHNAHNDGLVGYLEMCARKHPKAFMTLLAKIMPMQVNMNAAVDNKVEFKVTVNVVGPEQTDAPMPKVIETSLALPKPNGKANGGH